MTEEEYLNAKDEAEAEVQAVCDLQSAEHVEDDIFERADGSRFRVTDWPHREEDYDVDEETGRAYKCGWYWTGLKTKEVTK